VLGGGAVTEAASVDRDLVIDRGTMLASMCFLVRFIAEILELDVKVRGAEDLAEVGEDSESVVEATRVDKVAHLSVAAGGETDEPLSVGAQGVQGDKGYLQTFGVGQMGGGKEVAEVGVTLAGLGEEEEVIRIVEGGVRVRGRRGTARGNIWSGVRGLWSAGGRTGCEQGFHPYLGPEDGLNASLGAGLGKTYRAVEPIMVGEGQGRLTQLGGTSNQILDAAATVEEREVRMHV